MPKLSIAQMAAELALKSKPKKVIQGASIPKTLSAGDIVSGMLVRKDIPNRSSIGASLYDYSTHGVQEVPMSAFEVQGKPKYRSVEEENYTKDLARQIQENKELNPLIVVKDDKGHYILEGAHRFDALRELGIESFPALMVHDLESLPNDVSIPDITKANGGMVNLASGGVVKMSIAGDVTKQAIKQGVKKAKAPEIMKRVSKPIEQLRAELMDMRAKGQIQETGKPVTNFVRPDPKSSKNPAGYSKRQFEKNAEYEHDIRPTHEFGESRIITPEDLEGKPLVMIPGDRTRTGADIYSVNGIELAQPSHMYGGPNFGKKQLEQGNPYFWASEPSAATGVRNKSLSALEATGQNPIGLYSAMGSESGNFSMHNTDTALQMIMSANPNKKQLKEFENIIKQGNKSVGQFPEFVGFKDMNKLREQLASNSELRKFFIDRLETPSVTQGLDLPEGLAIRNAITEPELVNVPAGSTGFAVGKMSPEEANIVSDIHPTYSNVIPGEYQGQMQLQAPWEKYFPQSHAKISNEQRPQDVYGTMKMSNIHEVMQPQTVDELSKFYEMIKNGYKEGGQVQNFDKGGKADDVSVELMGDINYQPDPTYTDPMGMSVPSQDEMKLALTKQNMSPMPYPEPYRDPITGAILENGLEALPPGSNVPKSGGMTPIDYDNLPEEEKERTLGDRLAGLLETGTTLGTGAIAFPYAFGKGLMSGDFNKTFEDTMANNLYIPRDKGGIENLEILGKALNASKLPPLIPEIGGLEPIISSATKRGLQLGAKGVKATGKALGEHAYNKTEDFLKSQGLMPAITPEMKPSVTIEPFSPKDEFGFYSKLEKEAQKIQRKQGNGQAFKNDLLKLGVKPHELEDTGMDEFLKNNKNLTRDDVIGFAQRNRPVMKEIEYSDSWSNKLPKFEDRFRTPGGNDYHELLIQLPQKDIVKGQLLDDMARRLGVKNFESLPMEKRHEVARLAKRNPFTESNHFPDEENIMAILRMDSRTDTEGKRGMLLDELQSDWHQRGREQGYIPKNPTSLKGEIVEVPSITFKAGTMERSPPTYKVKWEDGTIYSASTKEQAEELLKKGKPNIPKGTVPDAPYKDNWYELGLKKAIQHMVTSTGDDRLYLPTGETVADRYSLEKHIQELHYSGTNLIAYDHKGKKVIERTGVTPEDLPELIGKEASKKLLEQEPQGTLRSLVGQDLRVGGEGMRKYYDEIYPSYLKKFAKKYGGHVGETEIETAPSVFRLVDENGDLVHSKEFETMRDAQRNIEGLKISGLVPQDTKIKEMKGKTQKVYYYEPSEEAIIKINGGLPYKNGGVVRMAEGGMAIESPPQFGVLPETFPSIEGEEAEAIRRRLANTSAMNLANENYTKGLNTINVKTPEDQDYANSIPSSQVGGYYDTKKGNEIVINPALSNINNYKTLPQVVGHEAQHLQDLQSKRGEQNILDRLHRESLQNQIEKNFQRVKGRYPEYADIGAGYYNNKNVPFSERLADLAGYEAILPKGQRLVDTPFGKEVFNTPSLQNFYHQSVRPMEQKMMPQTSSVMERNPVVIMAQELKDLSKPKLDEFKARLATGDSYADALYKTITSAKFAEGGSVESDPSFPIQAHVRNFQSPDLMDIQDYGMTARDDGDAFTIGRQLVGKNANDENPNMRFKTSQDYAQYATPMYHGRLNARVMKNPEQPSVQAMLQYMQEMGGGTAGIGLMGNRTSEGDKLRALQIMYNKQLSDTSDISGMLAFPFGDKLQGMVQYRKRFAEGGSVAKNAFAEIHKILEMQRIHDELNGMTQRTADIKAGKPYDSLTTVKPINPEQVQSTYNARQASPSVGLQIRGGSRIPNTQLELFKKKGGNVSIDEMQLALIRKK